MGGQGGQAPPPGLPPTPVPVPSADRHQRPSPGYKGSWVSRERLNKGHHNCPWRPVATPSVTELGSVGLPNWRFHLTSVSICPVLKAGSTHCVLRQEQRAVPRPPPPPQARGIRCHWGGGRGRGFVPRNLTKVCRATRGLSGRGEVFSSASKWEQKPQKHLRKGGRCGQCPWGWLP